MHGGHDADHDVRDAYDVDGGHDADHDAYDVDGDHDGHDAYGVDGENDDGNGDGVYAGHYYYIDSSSNPPFLV